MNYEREQQLGCCYELSTYSSFGSMESIIINTDYYFMQIYF